LFASAPTAITQTPMLATYASLRNCGRSHARLWLHGAAALRRVAAAQQNEEFSMTHPKHRLTPLAVATLVIIAVLAACQERKPAEVQVPSASSGEYPTPSEPAPSAPSDGKVDGKK
jgi:ferredoxin-NADP reductase